jgi:DNA-directed RNA polymerase II subunit RPB3
MNPVLQEGSVSEVGDLYKFTLTGINVSLANALRRIILSEVPTLAIFTETYNDNQCIIHDNTTRLHNEIVKQRLSCVPIHEKDLTLLPGKYILDLDVQNDTENMMIVTTEHFRIRNKSNGNYLTKDETRRIFPANSITQRYIDFVRLRPKISDSIPGEKIKLTAEISVRTAKENSSFNVVSKCSYGNTPNLEKIETIWEAEKDRMISEQATSQEIDFQKRNFYILDAQRHFKDDSFDFVIQTIGVYDNKEIVKKACSILVNKFTQLILDIESDIVPILNSETTMDYCYDIILENEDYTIGKVLEYFLYEKYYMKDKVLTYCGFKKFHPHNPDSTLRLAYVQEADKRMVGQYLSTACNEAITIFKKIEGMF